MQTRPVRPEHHLVPRACRAVHGILACLLVGALASAGSASPQDAPRKSPDEIMAALQQKYGPSQDKYDDLARRIEKAVSAALGATAWLDAGTEGERRIKDHPGLATVHALAEAARSDAKKRSKNDPETKSLLTRHPWDKQLELAAGLDYGSDRPIPDHENGFISLGSVAAGTVLPELPVNQYLYGFGEIVGWQYRIKAGKKLAYEGRTAKDPPAMATELPGWESVRVYLKGNLPEVPLLAVPWLTHCIHARLAERRRAADGAPAPLDEFLALLDSRWNGFHFQLPYCRDRLAIAAPLLDLYVDRESLVYQFPSSVKLESVGDLPFISDLTLQHYAEVMLEESIDPEDFIVPTPQASAARDRFSADCKYVARYKALLDEIVRAVLVPGSAYPAYLATFDFPKGVGPTTRTTSPRFGVPRKYALLLWAWAGKDPVKLADFLHDHLLSRDDCVFRGDEVLQQKLVVVVREHEVELMRDIVARITAERSSGGAPADFEREFSPYPTYLTTDGQPNSDYLVHSYQTFHESPAAVVREAALAVALAEVR